MKQEPSNTRIPPRRISTSCPIKSAILLKRRQQRSLERLTEPGAQATGRPRHPHFYAAPRSRSGFCSGPLKQPRGQNEAQTANPQGPDGTRRAADTKTGAGSHSLRPSQWQPTRRNRQSKEPADARRKLARGCHPFGPTVAARPPRRRRNTTFSGKPRGAPPENMRTHRRPVLGSLLVLAPSSRLPRRGKCCRDRLLRSSPFLGRSGKAHSLPTSGLPGMGGTRTVRILGPYAAGFPPAGL